VTLPRSVKVGPHTYSVRLHPAREMFDKDGNALMGDTDEDALEIRLRWGMKLSKKREILWHEIAHACADLATLEESADEETWVAKLSPMQVQVLQENPQLVKFLTRDK
jgi:hypothetical protein